MTGRMLVAGVPSKSEMGKEEQKELLGQGAACVNGRVAGGWCVWQSGPVVGAAGGPHLWTAYSCLLHLDIDVQTGKKYKDAVGRILNALNECVSESRPYRDRAQHSWGPLGHQEASSARQTAVRGGQT